MAIEHEAGGPELDEHGEQSQADGRPGEALQAAHVRPDPVGALLQDHERAEDRPVRAAQAEARAQGAGDRAGAADAQRRHHGVRAEGRGPSQPVTRRWAGARAGCRPAGVSSGPVSALVAAAKRRCAAKSVVASSDPGRTGVVHRAPSRGDGRARRVPGFRTGAVLEERVDRANRPLDGHAFRLAPVGHDAGHRHQRRGHAAQRRADEHGERIGAGLGGDQRTAGDEGEEQGARRPETQRVHCVHGEDRDNGDHGDDRRRAPGRGGGAQPGGEQQHGPRGEDDPGADAVGAAFAVEDGEGAEGDEERDVRMAGEDHDGPGERDGGCGPQSGTPPPSGGW